MFDWLFGNSRSQDRVDRILEGLRKPMWVIPPSMWRQDTEIANLKATLTIAEIHLELIVEHGNEYSKGVAAAALLQIRATATPAPTAHETAE